MIGIRADANSEIASGHMMRCITIARALIDAGEKVIFFMADEESYELFKANVSNEQIDAVILNSDYKNMDSEIDTLKAELEKRSVSAILVDSYAVTASYFKRLNKICKVVYLDDLHEDNYSVDAVINYSGYSFKMGYDEGYREMSGYEGKPTRLYLGLKYAPLRKQFYETTEDADIDASFAGKEGKHILVSTGGADMRGMLSSLLEMAENDIWSTKIVWHFVVGRLTGDTKELLLSAGRHDNIVIHKAVSNMAYLMKKCDLGVMAAGTMLTECAACGLPTVFYQVADNQKYNVEYWGNVEGMSFAGNVATEDKKIITKAIQKKIEEYIEDTDNLDNASEKLRKITDGRGALEIARVLMGEK